MESSQLGDILGRAWRFTLFEVGEHGVHVSQIVVALVVLFIGMMLSRWIARRIRNRLLRITRIDENSALLLERLATYTLVVLAILAALQVVGLPITIFAFLGGAVAIGIGFGAQNIFNNFISGLILMIERPVRVGDFIEVGTDLGRVVSVGARCTSIRRFDGVEMLLPNSSLLENNLVNRTLTDKQVRTSVSVGVAYGSPVKQVAEIIDSVARQHPEVLSEPGPVVLFQEFGDNALNFEVLFWAEMTRTRDLRTIRSDIRFGIDEMFRDAGITIAFPQRDVHLDSTSPVEVRLVGSE
jgi:small-conductance mechanosensitive channel